MGFLPGTVEEKMAPYTYSSIYLFKKILGEQKVDRMIQRGHIEIMALAFLRGVNIDNSILICEEAQNLTKKTAKTLLTRIGENAKFILNGDLSQSDRVKNQKESGLFFAMDKLKDIPQIGIFEFKDEDIVRNPVIGVILQRFNGDAEH
jgi:phosphate starvation-inducible PhoH-like protein